MNTGDRVRLRDGVLPWIAKRDGWYVQSRNGRYLDIRNSMVAIAAIDADDIEPESPTESLDAQINRLARFIMEEVPGEPTQPAGAVDTAIRIIRELQSALIEMKPAESSAIVSEPSIPPEPPRVVGQAWRDACGRPVSTEWPDAEGCYHVTHTSAGGGYNNLPWASLAHPLTPLYPVPDPDDDEAVERLSAASRWVHRIAVRAVLRALGEGQG